MEAVSIIASIYKITESIYTQAKKVEANQAQCALLAKRVQAIEKELKKFEKIKNANQYCDSLNRLYDCVEKIQGYMQALSKKNWALRFFQAGSINADFQQFNAGLDRANQDLSLGLTAQILKNQAEDQKAAETDRLQLFTKQDEILRLNQQILQKLNKVPDASFQQRQMASIKGRLDLLLAEKKAVPAPAALALDEKIVIPYFSLSLEEKIGKGSFGTVYKGRWHDETVAIKVWDGELSAEEKQHFIHEVQTLQHLSAPNFVPKFYGASLEANQACLVMEYCSLGSLDVYITRHSLTPDQQRHLALSIAKDLNFLHQKKVIHRTLKSANVLLAPGASMGSLQAKITGFGVSKTQYPSIVSAKINPGDILMHCAPELLTGQPATFDTDVFNYGILLWEILSGRSMPHKEQRKKFAEFPADCKNLDPAYTRLIQQCWNRDPEQRPSINGIISQFDQLSVPVVVVKSPAHTPSQPVSLSEFSSQLSQVIPLAPPKISAYDEAKQYHEKAKQSKKPEDFRQARTLYQKALTEEGEEKARVKLAALLIRGDGGDPKDLKEEQARAVTMFQQAAETGDTAAMKNLEIAYRKGIGVAQDLQKAAYWQAQYTALSSSSVVEYSPAALPSEAAGVHLLVHRKKPPTTLLPSPLSAPRPS